MTMNSLPEQGKIFGIGLQRTGTTSLSRALCILGYSTRDAPFVLYKERFDPILQRYQAFTDNPLPLFYQEYDRAFPGSKFILSTRAIDDWIKSVAWLFKYGSIEFNWTSRPVVQQVHRDFYGQEHFDESLFRSRFVEYHQEVQEYFAGRESDLLQIDFSAGEPWPKLCKFLGKTVPSKPFPHRNKSSVLRTARLLLTEKLKRCHSGSQYMLLTI